MFKIVYKPDGKIEKICTDVGPEEIYIDWPEHVDDTQFYVDIENFTIRDKLDYSIENLPTPSTIIIEEMVYEITEKPVFEFDTPGTYTIRVIPDSPQYLEKEFEYVVEA